mmetsp:Transcript_71882/g.113896  ORF Transcript_71882/g.113896 Transcript_71882/m.113896 type:complete len:136 (+) Transcript_71882:75-482(+)
MQAMLGTAVSASRSIASKSQCLSLLAAEASGRLSRTIPGLHSQQVRCRQWIYPNMATKGWRPERFEYEGQALQFAREGKRVPLWKLGVAARVSKNHLDMVEKGKATLCASQRAEIERLIGVHLKRRRTPRIDRTP